MNPHATPEKACARLANGRHEKLTDGRPYHASSHGARFTECTRWGVFSVIAKLCGSPFWWAEQKRWQLVDEIERRLPR